MAFLSLTHNRDVLDVIGKYIYMVRRLAFRFVISFLSGKSLDFFFFLCYKLIAGPRYRGHAMRQLTGNTSMAMRFLWTCCVKELLIFLKSTHRMLK